jgi:type II secretory ATPase GspE/PulE/Tfp pilus assembly ATPase PilB-like protein
MATQPGPNPPSGRFKIAGVVNQPSVVAGRGDRVVQDVNEMITNAAVAGASDIHIEPHGDEAVVRIRVDGVLQLWKRMPLDVFPQVVTRIKVLAKLDLTERRLPMDGRVGVEQLPQGIPPVDLRVSTVPLLHGEKVCVRLIRKDRATGDLSWLGLAEHNLRLAGDMVESATGLLLFCGPAGSGKTTSAYIAIHHLNDIGRNISTVEDPIEYDIKGVNQAQVSPEADLTFTRLLRAYLRQDCNVILVGEVRDKETCDIAVEAALTGHKIIATIHASDAVGTIVRLQEMGIPNYFIGSALTGVINQRLVRRLCEQCRRSTVPQREVAQSLGLPPGKPIYRATGCAHCANTGYRGRLAICEILYPDDDVRARIYAGASPLEVESAARQATPDTLIPIWVDGSAKVRSGETSFEEIVRVIVGVSDAGGKKDAPAKR